MATIGRTDATGDLVARAHAKLLADHSLQFQFTRAQPPRPPDWLLALFKSLRAFFKDLEPLGPVFQIALWAGLALLVAWLAWGIARLVVERRRRRRAGERPPHGPSLGADPAALAPSAQRARSLLEEADRLAAERRFAEAAHVLLFRTLADLDSRRPRTLRPALTGRDIAALDTIPRAPRAALSIIVSQVERSFFGGRELDGGDFTACRAAYLDFASPASWSGSKAA